MVSRKGALRAYWLAAVVCLGGFLFGYDSGIIGGVLTLKSFENDYRYTKHESTRVNSLAVSLQNLGAFVACFAIWPVTHRIGRRISIMICSFIFCIGVIVQTINTHSLPAFYVARVIAGLGLGGATVVVPMYNSEMAPKELRGQVGCFFQLFFTFGVFTSYWIDYGVSKDLSAVSKQWQIPVGLQLVPGALLGLGMLTLKESVRWLTKRGEHEKAWESLKWMRASDSEDVRLEMEEIRTGVAIEIKVTEGFKLSELLQGNNFARVFTGFVVFLGQQSTGATAFAYFAPQFFKLITGTGGTQSLLLTGIFGAVKVISCGFFVLFLSERVGRRQALIWGAVAMAVCFFIVAGIDKDKPPPGGGVVTSAGIATIAFIYLFVMIYNMSWGALPWPYVSEIFPTRIREPGIAVGVASQWLFNFVYTLATPYMIASMAWGTFLLWGMFNLIIAILTFLFLKETRGRSLEEITADFQGKQDVLANKLNDGEVSPAMSSDGPLKGDGNARVERV
ncbi:MAG: hypothetical protein M1828_002444 [Chrysothrix sp. TS-e1954]|nr:MAG: hypothetical protein M1828_002444 [Chrysothrix sp. TS-e1954]